MSFNAPYLLHASTSNQFCRDLVLQLITLNLQNESVSFTENLEASHLAQHDKQGVHIHSHQ
jgi:hypothetical protein